MNFFKIPLLKDFFSYGLVGVLGKAINIFVIPLYVKYLSVEEFGVLEIFVTAIAIFTLISTFQLDSAFLRFYSQLKNKEDIDIYFSTGLNSIFLLLFPFCFITYFIMKSFFIGINNDVLYAIIILIPVKSLFSYIACIFRVTFNRSLFIKINLINIIGIPILSVVLLSLNNGINGIILSTIILNIISLIAIIIITQKHYIFQINNKIIKRFFIYSLPLIPASISVTLQQNLSKFFITAFLSLTILGYYSFALKVFIPFALIIQSLKMAWYPRAFKIFDSESKSKTEFLKIEKYYVILVILVFLFLISISEYIINYFGAGKMDSSEDFVVLIGTFLFIRALSYFYIASLNIIKKTNLIFQINLLSVVFLIINLSLLYYFKKISIVNIIFCEIVVEFIRLLLICLFSNKYFNGYFKYRVFILFPLLIILNLWALNII